MAPHPLSGGQRRLGKIDADHDVIDPPGGDVLVECIFPVRDCCEHWICLPAD
jgi:hypothetical protein